MELASRTSNICVCCYLPVNRPDKYEFSEHGYHQQNQLKTQVQPYFTSYRCVGHYFRVSGPFWLVPAPGRLERGGEPCYSWLDLPHPALPALPRVISPRAKALSCSRHTTWAHSSPLPLDGEPRFVWALSKLFLLFL